MWGAYVTCTHTVISSIEVVDKACRRQKNSWECLLTAEKPKKRVKSESAELSRGRDQDLQSFCRSTKMLEVAGGDGEVFRVTRR